MRKFVFGLAVLAIAQVATADMTATWLGYTNGVGYGKKDYHSNWAVELIFTPQGLPGYTDGDSFRSFCLEWNEGLSPGVTFDGVISDRANAGGIGGDIGPGGDPLSSQTAWLYQDYVANGLQGGDLNLAAASLQEAIWAFEGESQQGDLNTNTGWQYAGTADLITAANDAVNNGFQGIGNVRVLQLYYPNGDMAQDVLVMVPAPGAALLAMIGLPIVGWVKRRLA